MSKTYHQKNAKKNSAGKILGIIAAVLAVVIVLGTIIVYNVLNSGIIERNTVAVKTENYEVTSAMLTYYYNSTYQNFVSSYGDYLSTVGLDTTKSLKEQKTSDGSGTWHDYFLNSAETNAQQLLVLCEAAKADEKFDYDKVEKDIKKEIDETVDSLESGAKLNNVTLPYYLSAVYGASVNEKVIRECMLLSEMASHYSEHMADGYKFDKEDWDKYYTDNSKTYLKADWLTYAFDITKATVDKDATDAEKADAAAKDKAAFEANKGYADALSKTTSAEAFNAYVEDYLRNVKYKGMDEAALAKDKIDIKALVEGCEKLGNTGASDTALNKWAFDKERTAYNTYVDTDEKNYKVTVYMILPAENTEDLGFACQYRDAYNLKDINTITLLTSNYNNSDADTKAAAEKLLEKYNEDKTEENFKKIADANNGAIGENADKGAVSEEADKWLYDASRKEGDCEMFKTDTGYTIVYYMGEGDVKWEAQADTALINEAYSDEYTELEKKYDPTSYTKGLALVAAVDLSGAASSSNK